MKYEKAFFNLLDRIDLLYNLGNKEEQKSKMENFTAMLYKNETPEYETEFYLSKIKFKNDTRISEANHLLCPTRMIKVNSTMIESITDLTLLESEKFILVYKSLNKQYTSSIGNGALHLNTIKAFPKEIINIQP